MAVRNDIGSLATFEQRSAENTTLHFDGTTATGKYLGQVKNFSRGGSKNKVETQRISDSTTYRDYTTVTVNLSFDLYEDNDFEEVLKAFGVDKPTAGGWVGTEQATWTVTAPATESTITIAHWASEATNAALYKTETISNWTMEAWNADVNAGEKNMWHFEGTADSWTGDPEAGVGA